MSTGDRWRTVWRVWPWLAAVATGVAAALAIPPCDQTWLCWLALIPLTFAVWFSGKKSPRRFWRDLALGYVAGLTFFWISFFWLTTVTGLGWFVLEFYMAMYFAVWAWCCGMVRPGSRRSHGADKWSRMLAEAEPASVPGASPWLRSGRNLAAATFLAATWSALEWVRGWMFSGFGWNGLGVSLHAVWPIIQIAEFTGVPGVSFVVAFANVILATTARRLWEEARTHSMRPHYDLTLSMAGLMAIFTVGINLARTQPGPRSLKIALIQSAVAQEDKFDLRNKQIIFDKFSHLTEIALSTIANCDLMVWPESSMPAPVLSDRETFDFVNRVSVSHHVDILLGAIDENRDGAFNAALLFAPPLPVQTYHKVHLVPFGEYIPFRYSFPLFAMIVGQQVPGDFDKGRDCTVFQLSHNRARVAPLVCFEDTLGELTRRFVLGGAELLVNVTNDGWFLRSVASRQQLANAVFRCVETRRPMVRAANTGVTCFVNDAGRVTEILRDDRGSIFEEGTLVGTVNLPAVPKITFYTRHGELFAQICTAFVLMVIAIRMSSAFWQRRKHRRQ